jgi:glycosyltransferase involved in cell wall biosynthesis
MIKKKTGIRKRFRRLFSDSRQQLPGNGFIRLTPERPAIGRVLISYATNVYLDLLQGKDIDRTHISAWQNCQISSTFLDLGFEVDIFHFEDHEFTPDGEYDVALDIASNLGRIADNQAAPLVKILYPAFAHWTEHNTRSYIRHRALANRRGVSIPPKRLVTPNDSVERANHIMCKGGNFGRMTYAYSGTKLTPVIQIRPAAIDQFIKRNVCECKRNFVWIGGSSAVHKGLDLLLEAFADMPDMNLTVIGNVPSERLFAQTYKTELFGTPNIRAVGWVDTMSPEFHQIVSNSLAIVAPSATELSCGSVIAGMMSGLIPVTTEGTDIDVSEIGISIKTDTVNEVREAVLAIANETDTALQDMSRASWEASQSRYGRAKFLNSFRQAICGALNLEPVSDWQTTDSELKIPANIQIVRR